METTDSRYGEVALYGGSFNPPHMGHVYAMAQVLATEAVEEIWLLPTYSHAFGKDLAPFDARVEMCRRVATLFGEMAQVSRVEEEIATAGRPSYTIETLDHLRTVHPRRSFSLVIGSDNLPDLDRWHEADRLKSSTRLVVVHRQGHPMEGGGPPIPDVSSTWIRRELAAGRSVSGFVPREVVRLCEEGRYYTG